MKLGILATKTLLLTKEKNSFSCQIPHEGPQV